MTQTLWPPLPMSGSSLRGMKRILEEAGSGLTESSGGALRFFVHATAHSPRELLFRCLVEPAQASHIQIEVCRVETGLTGFPANIYTADEYQAIGIKDEAELLKHLATVFQSERTKEVLVNLIANFG